MFVCFSTGKIKVASRIKVIFNQWAYPPCSVEGIVFKASKVNQSRWLRNLPPRARKRVRGHREVMQGEPVLEGGVQSDENVPFAVIWHQLQSQNRAVHVRPPSGFAGGGGDGVFPGDKEQHQFLRVVRYGHGGGGRRYLIHIHSVQMLHKRHLSVFRAGPRNILHLKNT